ncbi:hypothetical protein OK107_08555 [Lacticaseibacillus paracasei]|uniref:hypothetical protein n=1 Tax=Lacticaseibacillus paracasei TaxID=1597 RepID=UPI0022EC5D47|nr:hypothetical protein [Lacticaseibacillus paracasei]WBS98121.1 hypothetical protein OK107_08555 [Lacticaseibacillus paracasei]
MSNETKRDVFKDSVDTLHVMDGAPDDYCKKLLDRYDAALPDDLPVIPRRVSKILRITKSVKMTITQALIYIRSEFNSYTDWSLSDNNSETFARAWLLGVWRVEETGEVVKL